MSSDTPNAAPKPTSTAAVDLLRSIDAKLGRLIAMIGPLTPKPVADDKDLNSQYGDPEIRLMPRDWNGPDYKGLRLSQCPVELLDQLASMHDYFAEKADAEGRTTANGKPVAPYERKAAARARGWAKRIRDGKHTPPELGAYDGSLPGDFDDGGISGALPDGTLPGGPNPDNW